MISSQNINLTADTYIDAALPTTNYRTDQNLLLKYVTVNSVLVPSRLVFNIVLPSSASIDPNSISSVKVLLTTKTVTSGSDLLVKTALLSVAPDFRFITWDNYNSGAPWSQAGGLADTFSETESQSKHTHVVGQIFELDITNSVLDVYKNGKSLNSFLLVWTETTNANVIYHSSDAAAGLRPTIVVTQRFAQQPDAVGRTTSAISIPSV